MQERRTLVCRFGEDPDVVNIVGIKNKREFKRYRGVNHHLDNSITLRIKSCEFAHFAIEIDITHLQKRTIMPNDSETSFVQFDGEIYISHYNFSENKNNYQDAYHRKKLTATITANAKILSPKQICSQNYQFITFIKTTPNHTLENFFDYFKSEIDAYQKNIGTKENEAPTPFKTPLPIKRKVI